MQGFGFPFRVAIRLPGRQTSRNRRGGLQGLLIEQARHGALVAKALCADGTENARWPCLPGHKPTQGFQPRIRAGRGAGRNSRQEHSLRQPGIVIRQAFFEPDPIFGFH